VGAGAIELHGIGTVGGRFARLAREAGFTVRAHDSRGSAYGNLAHGEEVGVLVDATPPRYSGPAADAWVRRIRDALAAGTHVVTCNKAPLAVAGPELLDAARAGDASLACNATVGGGTPVLSTLLAAHAAHGVLRVEATLSGTLAYVVGRVVAGHSLAGAVREAQAAGLAEPDPTLDLDGTDAFAKAVIVHNALFSGLSGALRLSEVHRPLQLEESALRSWSGRGETPAVVADISPGSVSLGLRADPAPPGSSGIHVQARLADGGVATVTGPGAGAGQTAAILLSDVQAVLAGRAPSGLCAPAQA
jgi:homoserine dehydrogenase